MHTILVVDDEEAICFAMSEYFQMQGYRVDCAQSLTEAETLLSKECYTVIIADLRLAGTYNLEGLEVVQTVKERCPQSRIIVLTAYGSADVEEKARQYGVDAFLHKPKPLPDVAQIVYGLIGMAVSEPQRRHAS